MKAYNGFPGAYRESQYAILKAAWSSGEVPRPRRCDACRTTGNTMNAHHEDYSQPLVYDALCCVCHLMVHCRWSMPDAWANYRWMVARGWQSPPTTQPQTMGVIRRHLTRDPEQWPGSFPNAPRDATVLDTYPEHQTTHPNALRLLDQQELPL